MSDDPRAPELDGLLGLLGEVIVAGIRVALPGRIVSYDKTKQKASVKALVKDAHLDAAQRRIVQSIPEIHGVPVMMLGPPRGRITFPVRKGDLCWLQFASSSISQWLQKGGEVDPLDDRHHDINDAVALVGLHNYATGGGTDAPDDAIVMHAGAGILIKLGTSGANLAVTRTTDVQAALIGALTDATVLDSIYTYGSTPPAPAPAKAAALAAVVLAVNNYFTANPVQGSQKVRAD